MVAVLTSERRRLSGIRSSSHTPMHHHHHHHDGLFKGMSPEGKKRVYGGDRVARKYRMAAVKKAEYRRLKAIVPAVAKKRTVSKVCVVCGMIKCLILFWYYLFKSFNVREGKGL